MKSSPSYKVRLYPLSLSLPCPRAAVGASLYLHVIYVTEVFADPWFVPVLHHLPAQSLLLPTSCCSFFGGVLPLLLVQRFLLLLPRFDLALLLSPCTLFQAFTWLQLLLSADDSQIHSTPPRACHPAQWLFSSLPFSLWVPHQSFSISRPKPGVVLPKLSLSRLLKCCHLIGSSVPKPSGFFKNNLVYLMHLNRMQILCTLCCRYTSPFSSHQTTSLTQVVKFLWMFFFEETGLVELYFWSQLTAFGFKDGVKCFSSPLRRQLPLFFLFFFYLAA